MIHTTGVCNSRLTGVGLHVSHTNCSAATLRMHGFTIVELLVVIVVIGILATVTIVAYNGITARAVAVSLQSDLANASKMLAMYQVSYGNYPTSIDASTYCPTPADTNYCLKASPDNSFVNYTANNGVIPQTYSLDILNTNGTKYYTNSGSTAEEANTAITIGAITGTAFVGSTFTAGARTPAAATVTYKWQRSTTAGGVYADVAGATASTYTLLPGDSGYYFKVLATGTGAYNGTATSVASAQVKIPVTAIAATTGTTAVGSTLTAGARTPVAATVSYQWQRATTAAGTYSSVSGATAATRVLVIGDLGYYFKVIATGTGVYGGAATSTASARVTTPLTGIAAITGTTTVGSVLTAGALAPAGGTATYQWKRNTVAIAGATANTYTLVAADLGTTITVTATGLTNYTGAVTSAATAAIN